MVEELGQGERLANRSQQQEDTGKSYKYRISRCGDVLAACLGWTERAVCFAGLSSFENPPYVGPYVGPYPFNTDEKTPSDLNIRGHITDIRQENRPSKRQTEVRPYVDETLKVRRLSHHARAWTMLSSFKQAARLAAWRGHLCYSSRCAEW